MVSTYLYHILITVSINSTSNSCVLEVWRVCGGVNRRDTSSVVYKKGNVILQLGSFLHSAELNYFLTLKIVTIRQIM